MKGSTVVVPSYITAIYQDYMTQWNLNKIRNIAATQSSLQELRSFKRAQTIKSNHENEHESLASIELRASPRPQ